MVHIADRITLTFTFMDIEQSDECNNDAVSVRNGNDELAPLVGRYCGNSVPHALTSFGASFTVIFGSDGGFGLIGRNIGFRATYTTSRSGKEQR